MNRKGHIGTFLISVLYLILAINLLFVMAIFNEDISLISGEIEVLNQKSEASHELVLFNLNSSISDSISSSRSATNFEKAFNESLKALAEQKRASGLNTNLYGKIATGNYTLTFSGLRYELVVSDVFEDYKEGNNEVRYSYSMLAVFDKEKVISLDIEEDLYKVD